MAQIPLTIIVDGVERDILAEQLGDDPSDPIVHYHKPGFGPVGTFTLMEVQPATEASVAALLAAIGAKADASASSDSGTFSLIALVKRHLAKQSDGSLKSIVRGAAKGETPAADATVSSVDADHAALDVYVRGQVGGGLTDTELRADPVDVNIVSGAGSGGTAIADAATFTEGTTSFTPVGGYRNDSGATDVGEDKGAALRITAKRAAHVCLFDSSGNEVSVGGGTQYDEDTASASGEKLTMAGVRRADTPASSSGTDGDRSTLNADGSGRLWVNGSSVTQPVSASALPLPTGAATNAKLDDVITAIGTIPGGGGGGGTQYDEDTAHVSGDKLTMAGAVRRDTATSGASADGDRATLNVDANGRLHTNVGALPPPSKTVGTALLAHQSVSSNTMVVGSWVDVSALNAANVTIHFGRGATGAITTAPNFIVEFSSHTADDGYAFPLTPARYINDIAAANGPTLSSASAGGSTFTVSSATGVAVGQVCCIVNSTIGQSEWVKIRGISGTTITIVDTLKYAQNSSTLYTKGELITFGVDLRAVGRMRLVYDALASGQTTTVEARMNAW